MINTKIFSIAAVDTTTFIFANRGNDLANPVGYVSVCNVDVLCLNDKQIELDFYYEDIKDNQLVLYKGLNSPAETHCLQP